MATFEEHLQEISEEELTLQHVSGLEKIAQKGQYISYLIGYVLTVVLVFLLFPITAPLTFGDIALRFFGAACPGYISVLTISAIIADYVKNALLKTRKSSLKDFKVLQDRAINLQIRKIYISGQIEKRDYYLREKKLIQDLDSFITGLKTRQYKFEDCEEYRKKYHAEIIFLKYKRLQIHTARYYENRINTIKTLISRYDNPLSQHALESPVQSNSIKDTAISTSPGSANKTAEKKENAGEIIIPPVDSSKESIKEPVIKATAININSEEERISTDKLIDPNKPRVIIHKTSQGNDSPIHVEGQNPASLFSTQRTESVKKALQKLRIIPKTNFIELNKTKQNIGNLGELFVLNFEKKILGKANLQHLADRVIHVSNTSDSLGYDIVSYDEKGTKKYIEVKTSTGSYSSSFYLTENELKALNNLDNYFIYRVYDLNVETGEGLIFIVDCKNGSLDKYFTMEPTSYKISPKK